MMGVKILSGQSRPFTYMFPENSRVIDLVKYVGMRRREYKEKFTLIFNGKPLSDEVFNVELRSIGFEGERLNVVNVMVEIDERDDLVDRYREELFSCKLERRFSAQDSFSEGSENYMVPMPNSMFIPSDYSLDEEEEEEYYDGSDDSLPYSDLDHDNTDTSMQEDNWNDFRESHAYLSPERYVLRYISESSTDLSRSNTSDGESSSAVINRRFVRGADVPNERPSSLANECEAIDLSSGL